MFRWIFREPRQAPFNCPRPPSPADKIVLSGVAGSRRREGTVGAKEIEARPILRVGEILETIPGVIITQHAGGGKANQYFLRGFNLDHGTDIALDLDGMPLNLPLACARSPAMRT